MEQPVRGTRASLCLPVKTDEQRLAFAEVMDYVHDKFDGSTQSSLQPSVFRGFWQDVDENRLVEDHHVLVMIDIQGVGPEDEGVWGRLGALRAHACARYEAAGANAYQKEIWVVAHATWMFVEACLEPD